mgnify:CR=1 FL=1
MAVYTPVSADDLTAFLAGYDVGAAVSFKGIAEGVENSNFLLETGGAPASASGVPRCRPRRCSLNMPPCVPPARRW